ncbi:hypothetical protein LGQ02_03295 [Bacillus shivajii]|nr:hypothetical protein [Bacillus shivajii]UCZ53825.1 hypothetical protein LGQ02_03295 [Bacillus shivajii]
MSIEDLKEVMSKIKAESEERPDMCTKEVMNIINENLSRKLQRIEKR